MQQVKELYADTVFYRARYFDFSEGYGDKWEIAFSLTDEEQESEEFYPMMNYIYPLPKHFKGDVGEPEKVKPKLKNLPLTLVYLPDEDSYFLVLTGGGMDLSWQICEAYIRLGYLPPLEFCDLPEMAGMDYQSERNKQITEACLRSCEIANNSIEATKNRLLKLKGTEK